MDATPKAALQQILQIPTAAIHREHAQVVQVKITLCMRLLDFGRVNVAQPVPRGDRGCQVEIQPLQRVIHVAVFADAPIADFQIIADELLTIQQDPLPLACFGAFFTVQDERFGYPGIARLDQHFFDNVLNLFHLGRMRIAVLALFEQAAHCPGKRFRPQPRFTSVSGRPDGLLNAGTVERDWLSIAFDDLFDRHRLPPL